MEDTAQPAEAPKRRSESLQGRRGTPQGPQCDRASATTGAALKVEGGTLTSLAP
ncbi:hypothetical protein ACFU8W_39765 [Streptomyces sp. NPDC057565]|uniref:hypothetical protein n=1 Tax=Streptomyces sp. NPDC057565 TaxID=3346169 RepID=UPI00369BAD23